MAVGGTFLAAIIRVQGACDAMTGVPAGRKTGAKRVCMKCHAPASIVNTASVAGPIGLPTSSNYVAAKHGVVGLTKTAAMEYARDNIRVNCVNPGYIATPMTEETVRTRLDGLMTKAPINRMGQSEEIAELLSGCARTRRRS
jgi:NAD(P)-dependent dehydrogenase (short-subunit alcohol dehydrogenase family)